MKPKQRPVRCKRGDTLFKMEASLADRLTALHSPSCPRCPKCEARAKGHIVRAVRAHELFLRQCAKTRRLDKILRFSRAWMT